MAVPPDAREITSALVAALPKPQEPQTTSSNPIHGNPIHGTPHAKEHLLALHVLFPNELLPALDLLDRGLVTRLWFMPHRQTSGLDKGERGERDSLQFQNDLAEGHGTTGSVTHSTNTGDAGVRAEKRGDNFTYYVRSAQQQSSRNASRYRNAYEHATNYEVRLDAWSCSCPAFAFSAFPASTSDTTASAGQRSEDQPRTDEPVEGWTFGGLTRGKDMPVCKHLLACVLVERTTLFSQFVEDRTVSAEEYAGWAAGWGD